jgi:nucleolar protein 12
LQIIKISIVRTMTSLVESIFGNVNPTSSLSQVFEASSQLPERPQHSPIFVQREKSSKKKPKTQIQKESKSIETSNAERDHIQKPSQQEAKERKIDVIDSSSDIHIKRDIDDTEEPIHESTNDNETPNDISVEERTVFVGNLPLMTTRKSLKSLFIPCGKVESARLRSIATAGVKVAPEHKGNVGLVKKASVQTNRIDQEARSTAQGYVVFADVSAVENALQYNNRMVEGHCIRVDRVDPTQDPSRSVFIGNLPYQADEQSLRKHFVEGCSLSLQNIENVRIIRDPITQRCKGFGYILFEDKTMVSTALQRMNESTYQKRTLRVTVCGKRCKGRKGAPSEKNEPKGPVDVAGALKRILKKESVGRKRKRGDSTQRSTGTTRSSSTSRRQASEAKLEKRQKKLQKRVSKGMGKTKKGF